MIFKIIFQSDTEILFKNLQNNQTFSLVFPHSHSCSICFSPLNKSEKCNRHPGLTYLKNFILISGGYFHVNHDNQPLSWWTRKIIEVSEYPFQYSAPELSFIMIQRMIPFQINNHKNFLATMIPTSSNQMVEIYQEICKSLNIPFVESNYFFRTKSDHYTKSRKDYVSEKYTLNPELRGNYKNILLFDDVLHTGHTLGHCAQLLQNKFDSYIYLCPLSRTYGIKRKKFLKYPKKNQIK